MNNKNMHVSEVIRHLASERSFRFRYKKNTNLINSYKIFIKRSFLFLRHLPHCDWTKKTVSWPNLKRQFRNWHIINEESWKLSMNKNINESLSLPHRHNIRVNKIKKSILENGIKRNITFVIFTHGVGDYYSIIDGNHRSLALLKASKFKNLNKFKFTIITGKSPGNCRWHGDKIKWVKRPLSGNISGRYILDIWNK
jgi:hypothetical protein